MMKYRRRKKSFSLEKVSKYARMKNMHMCLEIQVLDGICFHVGGRGSSAFSTL